MKIRRVRRQSNILLAHSVGYHSVIHILNTPLAYYTLSKLRANGASLARESPCLPLTTARAQIFCTKSLRYQGCSDLVLLSFKGCELTLKRMSSHMDMPDLQNGSDDTEESSDHDVDAGVPDVCSWWRAWQ